MGLGYQQPNWTDDEWVLALDFYLANRASVPSKTSPEIKGLSKTLRRLNIHKESLDALDPAARKVFRNPDGIYMQVMSFASLDEAHKGKGIKSSKSARALWLAYHDKPEAIKAMADVIARVDEEIKGVSELEQAKPFEMAFAPEGKLLSYQHWRRERNGGLVRSKKKWFLDKYKEIFCEVCDFNYRKNYGVRGDGFMECHHLRPLSDGARDTKLSDLILICASCHRMIHRGSPWLEVSALKDIVLKRPHK